MTSNAPPPSSTASSRLGHALRKQAKHAANESGFLLVPDGVNALAIRLLLADQADVSIDAQYYEIDNDLTGHLFIEALLRAAQRGVKVRLLIDDYKTDGHDSGLAALREQPNFEFRIYNPYERKTSRIVEGLNSFARINRRMHNKSYTVDRQMTVIGGRNIGDPYFNVSDEVNFADLDTVAIGPLVADVSSMFDAYWNSSEAVPIEQVMKDNEGPKKTLSELLAKLITAKESIAGTKYADAIQNSILDKLNHSRDVFTWAPYQFVYDLPDKTHYRDNSAMVSRSIIDEFDKIENEVVLVSPYFVPRSVGVQHFTELRKKGIDVTVITNSLASNNQIYAHGGYAPVRKPLLKVGVRLFELRADVDVKHQTFEGSKPNKATLHTKAFAIDRRKLFIGSFNFDSRSANINTEVGVFIDSPKLATMLMKDAFASARTQSYEVKIGLFGYLEWHGWKRVHGKADKKIVLYQEPNTSPKQRAAALAAQLLPIRSQV